MPNVVRKFHDISIEDFLVFALVNKNAKFALNDYEVKCSFVFDTIKSLVSKPDVYIYYYTLIITNQKNKNVFEYHLNSLEEVIAKVKTLTALS